MKYRILNIVLSLLTLLSLALLVTVMVLWVRSYWFADVWVCPAAARGAGGGAFSVRSACGMLAIVRDDTGLATPTAASGKVWQTDSRPERQLMYWDPALLEWDVLGVRYFRMGDGLAARYVPYWIPWTSFGVLPIVWFLGRVTKRIRTKRGLCRRCADMTYARRRTGAPSAGRRDDGGAPALFETFPRLARR